MQDPLYDAARILFLSLMLLVAAGSQDAASAVSSRQLTDSQAPYQSVRNVEISPDSQWATYTGLVDDLNVRHLFSVPTAGGVATQLTERSVLNSKITADSARIVFLGDDIHPGQHDLFSIPIGGGVATRLTDVHAAGDGSLLTAWDLSATGSRVVYRGRLSSGAPFELFSVSVMGGPATRLNGDLVAGGEITSVVLSHDGTTVVYRADQQMDGSFEIFSVPVEGGAATRLNTPLGPGRSVNSFTISPDDSRVLYTADRDTDDVFELYSVPLLGGSSGKLSAPLVNGGNVTEALFTPDGSRVIYRADGDTDETFELYAVASQGGSVVKVNGPLVQGGDVLTNFSAASWLVDESSQWVVYRADQDIDGVVELFSSPLTGGAVQKLSPPMVSGGNVDDGLITHQGRVVFRADAEVDFYHELFSAELDGGSVIKLNDPLMPRIDAFDEVREGFLASSGEVYYIAPQETVVGGVYRVPINGGSPSRLSLAADLITGFQLSPDGGVLFYTAAVVSGRLALFRRSTAGLGEHLQLSAPSNLVRGFVLQIDRSLSTGRIVYSGTQDLYRPELFSLDPEDQQPLRLSDPRVAGGLWETFVLSPDGSRLVYLAEQDTAGTPELYSTSVTGGEVVKLNIPPAEGGGALFRLPEPFTPDGQTVVYKAYQGPDPACGILYVGFELFSVGSQGGVARTLYSPPEPCGDIFDFRIDPTGSFVVFSTFDWNGGPTRLFSVPVSGGPAVDLNPSGNATLFKDEIYATADGSRVIFKGSVGGETTRQLYSVPIAGGDLVRLNDLLPEGGSLSDFRLSSDGLQVVYRASQVLGETARLYSVSVEGGPVTELSGAMVEGGSVSRSFAISPSFGRVVFSADRETDGLIELYSVSLAGGPVSKLSHGLAPGDQVDDFAISEDAEHVVYRVRRAQDTYPELYRAPLAGGPAVRLSHPLTAGESITLFEINAQGSHVLYQVVQTAGDSGVFYRVPVTGGQALRFSSSSVRVDDDVRPGEYWFSPDGSQLLYAGTPDGDLAEEMFLAEELDLFLDGFESGGTGRWSSTTDASNGPPTAKSME